MGTTTFFLRHNDFRTSLKDLPKEELEKFDKLSPYKTDNHFHGWHAPLELHNRNIHVLIFWKGKLMRLEDAPKILKNKYYSTYKGKHMKEYEWTLLKKYIENNLPSLDKEFKKEIRK